MNTSSAAPQVQLFTKAIVYLLLASLLNAYAGGFLYAQQLHQALEIRAQNQKRLKTLGLSADARSPDGLTLTPLGQELSPSAVQARREAARAQLSKTRVEEKRQQGQQRARVQELAPQLRAAQFPQTLAGLSNVIGLLVETIRPFHEDAARAATADESLRLFFLRENIRVMSQVLSDTRTLDTRTLQRSRAVLEALALLGEDARGVSAEAAAAAARQVGQLLTGFVREDEARHRLSRGRGLPSPRFAGVDPLSGRPRQAPQRPQARATRLEPLPPLEGEALRLALLAPSPADPPGTPRSLEPTLTVQTNDAIAAPTSADLAATPDIRFTPELQAQADALGNDPVRIYDWVLRTVRYRLYAGSLQGSQGTLQTLEGNDIDQASLLIGLLRLSGIPARYETGTARVPIALVPGLTGIQDPSTAAAALLTEGVPATLVTSGTQPVELKVQRTWVRAQLPYTNYRGSQGTSSSGGSPQWVVLDPAFERLTLEQAVDLSGQASFEVDDFVSAPTTTSPRAFFEDALRATIARSGTRCETLEQAQVRRVVSEPEVEILPVKLPYALSGTAVAASALTSSQRYQVTVEALDSWGYSLFSRSVSLPELYGKRLSLTFPSGSGIPSASSGYVKPTLAVDSTLLVQGGSLAVGTELPVNVGISSPNRGINWHDHSLTAGGTYTFSAQAGPVAAALVADAEAERQSLKASGASKAQQDLATAYAAGLSYHQTLVRDDDALYALEGWLHFTELEAMTGADMSPILLWGLPYGAEPAGYVVDAENIFYSAPLRGTRSTATSVKLAERSGYNASYHEHSLWERIVGLEALSATNILQLSRTQGQTVYFLTSMADYTAIKASLSQPSAVLSDVTQALNAGDEVVIAQRPVTRGGKTVSGYVLFDPSTGAGRYLINSSLNGGVTLEGLMAALSEAASLFGYSIGISSRANIAEGSLSDEDMHLTFFAHGRPYVIELAYHSQQDQAGDLGLGWSWTFGERLFIDASSGMIRHLTPQAVLVPYTPSTGGGYSGPAGSTDVLAGDASGFTLSRKDGRQVRFDLQGRFVNTRDRHGNQIGLERDANGLPTRLVTGTGTALLQLSANMEGQLTQLQDGLGRRVVLSYTGGKLTQMTDPRGNSWSYSYGQGPLLIGKVEGDGTDISYGFDGAGRLAYYTTPTGGEGFFAFDHLNRQSLWTRPTGGEQLYRFDADGRLLERVDAVGNQVRYQYQNGYMSEVVDARGGVTSLQYDARGNVTRVDSPGGLVSTRTYDSQDRVLSHTETSGASTTTETYTFDDVNHVVTHVDADGSSEVIQTSATGQVLSFDRDGATASYSYDPEGNLVGVNEPGGVSTTIVRDSIGRVSSITGNDGNTVTVAYDAGDKPRLITLPNGATYNATYSPLGQLQSMTDPSGVTVAYAYVGPYLMSASDVYGRVQRWERDGAGQVLRQQDALGNTTTYAYDGAGRLQTLTDAYGQTLEYGYCADVSTAPCDEIDRYGNLSQRTLDEQGRVSSLSTPLGTTRFEYTGCATCGGEGRLSAVVNVLGERTEYAYDARGRLTGLTDALGQLSRYAYDARGRLTGLVDATGAATVYQRDARGQLEQLIDALNRTTYLTYDTRGLLTEKIDGAGQSTQYEYNTVGQVMAETFGDGTSRTFDYDQAGRLTRSTSEAADLQYTYADAYGRLTRMDNHTLNESLQVQYDPVTAQRAALIRPDGSQTFQYDQHGSLLATILPDGQTLRMRYDSFGQLAEKRYPNGLIQQDTRDRYGRLQARLLYAQNGLLLGGDTYQYDALGRRTASTDTAGTQRTYQYDKVGRLIQETRGNEITQYTYDAVGNRLSKSLNGTVTATYVYDAAHQLVSKDEAGATTTYVYTDAGWLESSTTGTLTTAYVYDPSGQLLETWAGGVRLARYAYDAQGRKVAWEDDRGARHILYDQEDAVVELDATGVVLRGFAHGQGLDEPLAQLEYGATPATYFYHTDAQGSVATVSTAGGSIVQRLEYSAFGEASSQGTATAAFTYQGRPYDPVSGLYDMRARQLDPRLGRFNTVDPLSPAALELPDTSLGGLLTRGQVSAGGMLAQPQWMNPFAYAGNDPVNLQDTLGQFILCDYQPDAFWSWVIGAGFTGAALLVSPLAGIILGIIGLLMALWQFGCQLKQVDDADGLTDSQKNSIKGFAKLIFVLSAIIGIAGFWLGTLSVFVALTLLITFYTIVMGLFIDVMINMARQSNRRPEGL